MPKIDDAEYSRGRELFAAGASVRQLVEPMFGDGNDRTQDEREASRIFGFIDGLLEQLRHPLVIVAGERGVEQ